MEYRRRIQQIVSNVTKHGHEVREKSWRPLDIQEKNGKKTIDMTNKYLKGDEENGYGQAKSRGKRKRCGTPVRRPLSKGVISSKRQSGD